MRRLLSGGCKAALLALVLSGSALPVAAAPHQFLNGYQFGARMTDWLAPGTGTYSELGTDGTGSNFSSARIVEGSFLPELKASAQATSNSNRSMLSYADAWAWQSYTYTGSEAATYQLQVRIDASEFDYADFYAYVDVTTSESSVQASHAQSVDDNSGPFSHTETLTFSVVAGDTVEVRAWMQAGVDIFMEPNASGAVDASHTLTAQFTAGNTLLLTPTVMPSPVPEPQSWALMAGGLALLARLRRRGHRR